MAIDTTTPTSRRALLAGLVGGLAAAVAGSVGRPSPVVAGLPPVTLGAGNYTTGQTSITNQGTGDGIVGISKAANGVYGSGAESGVQGSSIDGYGIHGTSDSTHGVFGASNTSTGVYGKSYSGYGVYGESDSNYAVVGLSKKSTGVIGLSETGYGVVGTANTVGVVGESGLGRGGRFAGKKAQVRLQPSSSITHPASGSAGDLFVDSAKRLWFCKGGTTWVQIA